MSALRRRLLLAEDDFLNVLQQGGDSLDAFDKRWASLLVDVEVAEENGELDTETLELAHATALRLSVLIETSVDVLAIHDHITSDLMGQLNDLMFDLSLSDSVSLPHLPLGPRRAASTSSESTLHSMETVVPTRKRRRRAGEDEDIYLLVAKKRCTTNGPPPSPICSRPMTRLPSLPLLPNSGLDAAPEGNSACGRKRCLSDTDTTFPRPSKRMRARPRLHAVSDSYSHSPVISSHLPRVLAKNLGNAPAPETPHLDATPTPLDSSTLFDIQPYIVPTDVTLTLPLYDSPDLGGLWSMLHPPIDIPGCNSADTLLYSLGNLSSIPHLADSVQVTSTDSTPSTPSSISTSISPITPALDACLDGSTILDPDSFSLDSYPIYDASSIIDPAVSFGAKVLAKPEGGDVHPYLPKPYDNQLDGNYEPELDPLFWLATSLSDSSQPNMSSGCLDMNVLAPPRTFISAGCIGLVASSPVQPV